MTLLRRHRAPDGSSGQIVGVTPAEAGWQFIHFAAYRLVAGGRLRGNTEANETALVVLGGRCTVRAGQEVFTSIGQRRDVWEKIPPYLVVLPPGVSYDVEAESDLHLAVAGAPAKSVGTPRLIAPDQIQDEHRGTGQTYRYIQHVLPPTADATRLILVEVYTPAGNWSSFPPHKHDLEDPPRESYLEETYYYQIDPPTGFALQRVYTADRNLDETVAPSNDDLVLIPRGYHPVVATPGHACYYLNVMAGPTRAWNFQVDPDYVGLMDWRKPVVAGGDPGNE